MGFQTNYTKAIKQAEDLVQIMFEKLSRCCKYCEPTLVRKDIVSPIPNACLYYGRQGISKCVRENCPLLEKEE